MNVKQKEKLTFLLGEDIKFDCKMAKYTTLGVGGNAEALCEIKNEDLLRQVILFFLKEKLNYEILGLGSNVVIRDSGVEGIIIVLKGTFCNIERPDKNSTLLRIGAGCSLGDFLNYCRKEGLGGIEFLAGIPGTIGGAVAMNAGAFGKEISSRVVSIELMSPKAENKLFGRDLLNFSYRSCEIDRGSIIVGCCIELEEVPREEFSKVLIDYLRKRKETQPLDCPSAGSVFKNPPGDYAGRLIEAAGLKGKKIGGAMISEKHANFIVNTGDAKAKDVIALINMARDTVREENGVELETEIKIMGGKKS
jgi:UDP-N-acetylmuramate dehydrogenase